MAATKASAKTGQKKTNKKAPAKVAKKAEAAPAEKPIKKSMAAAEEATGYMFSAKDQKTKTESVATMIPVSAITVVKGFNPRTNVGDMKALEDNIKRHGILVPLLVAPGKKAGTYELIAGERRLTVSKALGRTTVPVIIRDDLEDPLTRKAVAVSENSEDARTSLNHIELGRVFAEMVKADWTPQRIASETGVKVHTVRRCLDIMSAPADVQKSIESGSMSLIAGLEIAKLDDATRKSLKDSLHEGISAAEVRKLAKKASKEEGTSAMDGKTANKKKGKERDASLRTWLGHRAVQAVLEELCYYLSNATGEEIGTTEYHELRGAIGLIFWQRGDLDTYLLPALDPDSDPNCEDVSGSKKLNAKFDKLVKSEAAKFTPPEDEVEGEGEGEGEE